ncbi:mycofactocin dehydrogenase MftG [Rhodococcus triatomae]
MTADLSYSDVLVVGGGSAGCVVAGRVSADPACVVTLVESGPRAVASGPLGVLPVGPDSDVVWRHPAQLREDAPETVLARGRVVGGSGAVNGGYFVRATAADFTRWPRSWSYEEVLPHFRRLESDPFGDRAWHGDSGPMPVTRTADLHPVGAAFVGAATDAGFDHRADLNEPDATGVGPVPLNARAGVRVSTADAYLVPHADRPNLRVHAGVRAVRLVLDGTRVVGAEVEEGGRMRLLRAGTVVLCAGAVGTPHLLMHSGIGPAQQLSRLGLPVVLDRPGVGQGLEDHPEATLAYRPAGSLPYRPDRAVLEVVLETDDLELRPYTAPFGAAIPGVDDPFGRVGVALMRPDSRGEIVLRSADPAVPPLVRYRYLRSDADRAALGAGLDLAAALLAASGLGEVAGGGAGTDPLAGLGTSMHLSGGCAMGSADDPHAVVDDRCRVAGVDGLWIGDGSVFPSLPSRGPHATVVMVAERVARFVAGLDA